MVMKSTKKLIPVLIIAVLVITAAIAVPYALRVYKHNTAEYLSGAMTSQEISELEKYKSLREVDLSGSTCYDDIIAFAANHPEINVRYTVDIDGTAVSGSQTELDWSGRNISALTAVNPAYLPALEKIRLGSVSVEELSAVQAQFPNAALDFETEIAGQTASYGTEKLDFSALSHSDVSSAAVLLRALPSVTDVKLGNIAFEDYKTLFESRPDISYDYSFELFGKTVSTLDDTIKYKKVHVGDEGLDTLRGILPYMPKLTYLKLDRCDTTDAATEALNLEFPNTKIVWRIFFGGFSCLTDAEKIWAIGSLYDEDCIPLQYCHDIKYLDLGHNDIKRIDFVKQMPKLEVLILGCGTTEDISALEGCTTLEYLEITSTSVSDLSPLASCVNLKHFEMSITTNITDISPLYGIDLDRFHALYVFSVPDEQFEEYARLHPNCDTEHNTGTGGIDPFNETDWRFSWGALSPRYALLRQQIGYDDPYGPTHLYEFLDDAEE